MVTPTIIYWKCKKDGFSVCILHFVSLGLKPLSIVKERSYESRDLQVFETLSSKHDD